MLFLFCFAKVKLALQVLLLNPDSQIFQIIQNICITKLVVYILKKNE